MSAGYLKSAEKEAAGKKNIMVIRLASKNKKGAMTDFKLISKPSRHVYADYRSFNNVKQGYGHAVISTSKGIMTQHEARKKKIGGEYLFEIW